MAWSYGAQTAFALSSVILTSFVPAASGALSEADATRIFLEQSPQARRVAAIERSVDAAERVASRPENPNIAYSVEDAAGSRDEFLTLTQQLPISGRRGLLGERADFAVAAAALDAERALQVELFDMKRAFHEVVYREGVVDRMRLGIEQLERTVATIGMREVEGDASGYDLLRAEQQLAELRMAGGGADAALTEARSQFGSFFDSDLAMERARLESGPAPSDPLPDVESAVRQALERRPDLRSLSAAGERAELERKAARRRRVPEPTLGAGWKRTESPGISDTGYIVALSVPLPLFDRGRLEAAHAAAEGERVELEAEILTRRIRAEVRSALAREQAAREVAELSRDIESRAVALGALARMNYDEGESGVHEWLDVHGTTLTMQLRALAARHGARLAAIDREQALGSEVMP